MINFVNRTTGKFYKFYKNVLRSMIDPILPHLAEAGEEYAESRDCIDNAVNIHFFRENNIYRKHLNFNRGINVFISHGIADKCWRDANFVSFFDYVCVSGPLWVEKLTKQGLPKKKILVTGYTKLDPIFQGKYKRTPGSKKRVLWGPTHNLSGWTSKNGSTYPGLEPLLKKEFPPELEVIVSPHPANNDDNPTMQGLVDCDAVISDISSIVYEAWILGKPVIFPDWLVRDRVYSMYPRSFEEKIYREKIGLHANNMKELVKLCLRAVNQYIDVPTKQFIDKILPLELRGCSGKVTADILRGLTK